MTAAVEAQAAAVALHRAAGERMREGDGLRRLSRISYTAGDRAAAEVHARRAAELLNESAGPELAMAFSNLSQLAMLAYDGEGARTWGERAIVLAERLGRPDIVCHALNNIGYMEAWRDPDLCRRLLGRSLDMALEHGLEDDAGRAYANLVCIEYELLDNSRAQAMLDAGIPYCLEHDLDYMRLYMQGWKAALLLRRGEREAASAEALAVLGSVDGPGHFAYPAMTVLARLRTRCGAPPAEPMLDAMRAYLERGMELQRFAPFAATMAERAWLGLADRQESLALLDRALDQAHDPALIPEVLLWRRLLAPERPQPTVGRLAEPWRLHLSGDWRAAAAAWAAVGAPYEQALALLEGDARAQRRALAAVEALGAVTVADHVRSLLRRHGVTVVPLGPRASTRDNPAGLTRRQMDVLRPAWRRPHQRRDRRTPLRLDQNGRSPRLGDSRKARSQVSRRGGGHGASQRSSAVDRRSCGHPAPSLSRRSGRVKARAPMSAQSAACRQRRPSPAPSPVRGPG